jgi:hypothetical protein
LLFGLTAQAQLKFHAGAEWYHINHISIIDDYSATNYKGDYSFLVGASYTMFGSLKASLQTNTYFDMIKIDQYRPVRAEYIFNVRLKVSETVNMQFEHICLHPIQSARKHPSELYGASRKIGIYYNFK